MPSRRKRGTPPALRMAARQSRIRLACAQMALISLIFVTPMATSSSGLLGKLPDVIAEQKTEEGRPFRAALAGERTWLDHGWPWETQRPVSAPRRHRADRQR